MFKVGARSVSDKRSPEASRFHSTQARSGRSSNLISRSQSKPSRRVERTRGANRLLRKAFALCSAAFVGGLIFAILSDGGRNTAQAKPLIPRLDKLVADFGFGIDVITIRGHRLASDSDIFEALALKNAHSFVRFDSREAQRKIRELAWVKDVDITRVLPNRLEVTVSEREPYAVWRDGTDLKLVDVEGRVLSGIDERTAPRDLPRISGKGAPQLAGQLLALLVNYPQIAAQLKEAHRIVDRRWRLQLKNGAVIDLPADAESAALARLKSSPTLIALVDNRDQVIDLRTENRVIVQIKNVKRNKAALSRQSISSGPGSS